MEPELTGVRWFQLMEEPRVEAADAFTGGNVHPDRVMNQWVLVLVVRGQRTFRLFGPVNVKREGVSALRRLEPQLYRFPAAQAGVGLPVLQRTAFFPRRTATGSKPWSGGMRSRTACWTRSGAGIRKPPGDSRESGWTASGILIISAGTRLRWRSGGAAS